jgi:hypothetical protein
MRVFFLARIFAIVIDMTERQTIFQRIKAFFAERQQYVMPLVLIGGFVVDWFTLNQIDQVFDNMIFVIHLVLSGGAIAFLHATDERYLQEHPKRATYRRRAFLLMFFSLGALYSGFFIFYLRSSSLLTSWIIVFGLLAIMLSTEWLQEYYEERSVQVGVYYMALLCYSIFVVPILINKIGAGVFILSSVVSLVAIAGYVALLRFFDKELFAEYRAGLLAGIIAIVTVTNLLYFMNIIPPIPLSVKYRSPYSYIEKQTTSDGIQYRAVYEATPWYNILRKRTHALPWQPGQPVYVFASIFAPTDIETTVRHCWEYLDTDTEKWEASTCIPITIAGGRADGYRGFSQKGSIWPGRWRVRFVTQRGQVLGMVHFRIVEREIEGDRVRAENL